MFCLACNTWFYYYHYYYYCCCCCIMFCLRIKQKLQSWKIRDLNIYWIEGKVILKHKSILWLKQLDLQRRDDNPLHRMSVKGALNYLFILSREVLTLPLEKLAAVITGHEFQRKLKKNCWKRRKEREKHHNKKKRAWWKGPMTSLTGYKSIVIPVPITIRLMIIAVILSRWYT